VIALLDLTGDGLVREAVAQGEGLALRDLTQGAAEEQLAARRLDALIVECGGSEPDLLRLLSVARQTETYMLAVTRERGVPSAVATLRAGASDVLQAPFEYDALLAALDRVMDAAASGSTRLPVSDVGFLTQDPATLATIALARSVAASDATVLILGESGTGKELIAKLIHQASPRRRKAMVSVNCAALPAGLLESELFGHEKGAFTGAHARVTGKFGLADGTTLLLDEIGELELPLQAKLLRVIQEKQVQRIGAPYPLSVDFRLVATTNRDLAREVEAGRFREDLYYRLNVLPLHLAPLRERRGDVPLLLAHLTERHAHRGRPRFTPDALGALETHRWPGNVRELENVVARFALTHAGRAVERADLLAVRIGAPCGPPALVHGAAAGAAAMDTAANGTEATESGVPPFRTIRDMERWLIAVTLRRTSGNRTHAATELGISLRTLRNKIQEYQIFDADTLPTRGVARAPARHGAGEPRAAEVGSSSRGEKRV
jgi:two-component system response regulator FlrC